MKRKLYTRSIDLDLLKEIDNNGVIFTADEHAYISDRCYREYFKSKESLLYNFLSTSANNKLPALGFLIDYINVNGLKNILSMGAGECVLEYLLRLGLPSNANVIATDYDSFFIVKAKEFFPNIIPIKFDFFRDQVSELKEKVGIDFDISVFFGSAYVMDDAEFIELLKNIKEIGVKRIIDFHAGYIDWKDIILNIPMVSSLKKIRIIRKLLGKPVRQDDYLGKFHGYGRSRGELRKIYKLAGLRLTKEMAIGGYKYVAICNC